MDGGPVPAPNERFQRIIENTDAGYFRIGANGYYEYVNLAWLRMHGFTRPEDVIGLHFTAVHDSKDLANAKTIAESLMRGESVKSGAVSRINRDGTIGYHSFSAHPVFDGEQVVGVEGFLLDITDQRRTEERYKLIAENAADVIWLWDLKENRPTYVSPSVLRLRGFSAEEVMAQPLERAMPDDTFQMIVRQTKERIAAVESGDETARIHTNEVEYFRKDGSRVTAERVTTLISNEEGKVRHILGVSRDITERKRIENALRKSEEKFSSAFQSSPAGITLADLRTGSYLEVNGTFEQITGYRRDEVIGRSWEELRLWTDPSNRDEAVRRLLNERSLRNWEFKFRRKNGDVGDGLISADLIEIEGNLCAITATIDITERIQLENQLRQAQKLESIGRLAGGVAHDFNNLLTVIMGHGELLLRSAGATDTFRQNIEEIRKAAERAAGLTQQLLAFSRKQTIAPRPLDLNNVVKDAERMLRRLIGEDIEVVTTLDPLLGRVMADPEQVYQVMMNLVVNARDAMPDGGVLRISTMNVDVSHNEATMQQDAKSGRYVVMVVKDNGTGMDETIRQHIFEPFFTTKEQDKGTGLGLSTVYGIMRQSGGWVDVWSESGVGSSFKLYFPAIDACSVQESAETAAAVRLAGGGTLLVVEDQEAVRRLMTTILTDYRYEVIEAANGDEALAASERHAGEIHLLLTDVVLPGMNGKEVADRLKMSRPDMKVLFTSGYTEDVIGHRGVLDPGVAYLAKPFSPDRLAAKVREVLSEHSKSQGSAHQ
ncbi:MAG TPA: PAS domain S-box protein [Bryobacteraceae bacterium]|nr:PAS domain S-box protein [Bryobacteraceae bacterium]